MELELGLKITKTREDVSSSVDFHFSKDPFGPLVLSQEIDSRFIIIIHLKGFKKEGIEIDINKEGNRITVRGRKPVEEMVMIRWMAWRKEVEFRVFKKVFRIPDIVDLDKVKARFDDDDATLTITMPKRVKGVSGLKIEEEEEEEKVEFGDVSEAGEVEEESIEREEFDEQFETKIPREEEFGELEEEQKDEEETEVDNLEKIDQIDEQDKILEGIQEEEEEEELADSNKESEDSSLRKRPDIEGRDSHEQTRHEEQVNKVVEQQDSQAETNSEDFGSRAFEETEEQKPDEQLDRTSESGSKENKTKDDDGDGSSKVQGIEEAERRNEERKDQEIVEGETGGHKKENRDAKEEVDGKMGQGLAPNIVETETKAEEFESDQLQEDKLDKIHELVKNKEEKGENAKVQENEEQHSKGLKPHSKQENIKELVEEKTPEAGTNIPKPVQETQVPKLDTLSKTGDEGKEKKKNVKMEIKNWDAKAKEDVNGKMGKGFTPNNTETARKAEEFEYDKLKADEVDKIQKLVEKKEKDKENAKIGTQSADIGEQQFEGQKRYDKQEKIKELVEEQTPEAETNIGKERCEGKHKIQKPFQEETKDQPEECTEKIMETGKKTNDAYTRKVQEINRQQELDEPSRCEKESKTQELVKCKTNDEEKNEKEIAETETKEQESYRPKILREQEKIEELAEEKTNFSKNRKIKEEEEIAEKKTEFGDDYDDISRKVQDIEQRASDAMKGQEEKDMIQELVLEDKLSDGGKGIMAVADAKAEDDKSKNVQEIDEKQLHEEDTCRKQFQKLEGGEISGHGEVRDVEKENKTTEAEKRISDSMREAQEIGKKDTDVSEENRGVYRNEHEEEKKDEADRPEKITGTIDQDLVKLNSQLEQDNIEYGEKTQELVEEKIKDRNEEEGSEESQIKTDDDVVRKVQGIKEQELYEPKREHVSKIKELVEEKTGDHEKEEEKEISESEIEAECGSLRKVDGREEQELHEPKIHKEHHKTRITGAEEPSGQEKEQEEEKSVDSMTITENENSTNVQEIMEERPDKPKSHEKRYKIQEVVEAGHNDRKEEEQEEKVTPKAELDTEEESLKNVQEIEQQEYDGPKKSMVQDRMQETEKKEKIRAIKEKETVERRKKTKDDSLRKVRDDEGLELSKPYKRQKEDKIQELVGMGTSDYREKVKKQDEVDRPDLDEFERYIEQSNIPQSVEDESSGKFHEFEEEKSYEDWTREEREKRKDLVKEEATDPKYKHTVGEGHNDHKEEKDFAKAEIEKQELKIEEDNSKKVREIENQENDGLKRSMVEDKMQETEETGKTRAIKEDEIVERRKNTKDGSLKEIREGEDPQFGRHTIHGEEDKKKDEDGISKSQETGKLDLGELDRHCKQRKIHQSVGDEKKEGKVETIPELGEKMKGDSLGKVHEFQKQKSYEELRQEEATGPIDKHTGGEGEHEEERYEKVAETKTKVEGEINKNAGENKEPESDKQERYRKLDKLEGVVVREAANDSEKEEENAVDDFTTKIQETEKEESHEFDMHEKLYIVPDFVEDETGDQEDEVAEEAAAVVTSNESGSSRKVQTIKEQSEKHKEQKKIPETSDPEVKEEDEERVSEKETKELEAHVQELERKTENSKDDNGEGKRGEKGKQGKTVETMPRERFKTKSDDGIVRKIRETKVKESNENENQERKGKIEELERKEPSNHEVKLVTEEDSLSKGQEFLEKEPNVSKRRPVEEKRIQQLKKVEKRDQVNEDEEKAEVETKVDDGKSRNLEMYKMLELDESEEQKKIRKPMEEKSSDPEIEKEGDEKIAEDVIDNRSEDQEIKGQEPDELLKSDKIPQYHREEENVMEQNEKAKRIRQVESKANDDNLVKNETERHDSTGLRREKKKENHQELMEIETSDQRKEEKEEEVVEKAETIEEYDSSRKIHEHEERKSDQMSEKLAEEETKDDKEAKEGNRAGKVLGEVETKIGKVREIEEQGQDKKESFVEKDRSGKAKDNENQETKSRDEKQEKIQEPVDRETSEDEEEELEVEFEDEDEDWEAEVIQEMDSDEDIDKIKQIKRIRLGFRLVGGSTLFMSLIVIVISFIRSKRKIRCYKF